MLQTKFYDTLRFDSEEEAEQEKEIYRVKYVGDIMTITDPDGKETEKILNYRPVAGLDVLDYNTLNEFFDIDMEQREEQTKRTIK